MFSPVVSEAVIFTGADAPGVAIIDTGNDTATVLTGVGLGVGVRVGVGVDVGVGVGVGVAGGVGLGVPKGTGNTSDQPPVIEPPSSSKKSRT
jgi:hypothetical protein